jgi:hypothetical protein
MDWLNSTEILNLLNPTTIVNEVGFWFIITIFGAFWWIINLIIKRRGRKKEERELIENLLFEIKKNQDQLYPFSHLVGLDFENKLGEHNNSSEIEAFLRNAKKEYDFFRRSLTVKTFMSSYEVMEYLVTF